MPVARHFISCPGSSLKWVYINLTNWQRATNLMYLGLHHYKVFFLFQFCIYLLLTRKHPCFTKSSFCFITPCLIMYFYCCFCLYTLKKKFGNKRPCQTFIIKNRQNKTRVNLMETPGSVQLWLNIQHSDQTHHFLFTSRQR